MRLMRVCSIGKMAIEFHQRCVGLRRKRTAGFPKTGSCDSEPGNYDGIPIGAISCHIPGTRVRMLCYVMLEF